MRPALEHSGGLVNPCGTFKTDRLMSLVDGFCGVSSGEKTSVLWDDPFGSDGVCSSGIFLRLGAMGEMSG